MGRNGRKRGWCGGRRRDWKLRWQNRNIRVVESDDGEVEGDDEEVQGHLTFDPDTGLYTSGRGEQEGGGGGGGRRGAGEGGGGLEAGSKRGAADQGSKLKEQEGGAGAGSRGEEQQQEQEQLLWPGALFDSHCHLNLVLRL